MLKIPFGLLYDQILGKCTRLHFGGNSCNFAGKIDWSLNSAPGFKRKSTAEWSMDVISAIT